MKQCCLNTCGNAFIKAIHATGLGFATSDIPTTHCLKNFSAVPRLLKESVKWEVDSSQADCLKLKAIVRENIFLTNGFKTGTIHSADMVLICTSLSFNSFTSQCCLKLSLENCVFFLQDTQLLTFPTVWGLQYKDDMGYENTRLLKTAKHILASFSCCCSCTVPYLSTSMNLLPRNLKIRSCEQVCLADMNMSINHYILLSCGEKDGKFSCMLSKLIMLIFYIFFTYHHVFRNDYKLSFFTLNVSFLYTKRHIHRK